MGQGNQEEMTIRLHNKGKNTEPTEHMSTVWILDNTIKYMCIWILLPALWENYQSWDFYRIILSRY